MASKSTTATRPRGRPLNDPGIATWNGHAMRVRRLSLGISTTALAQFLGVSVYTLRRWERNGNAPRAEHVARIARRLRCERSDLARAPRVA